VKPKRGEAVDEGADGLRPRLSRNIDSRVEYDRSRRLQRFDEYGYAFEIVFRFQEMTCPR